MGQAKKETPRWKRRQPAPAGPVITVKGRGARQIAREIRTSVPAVQPGTSPPAGLLARTGAYRFRRHLIPVWLLAGIVAAGLGCHAAHSGKAVGIGAVLGVLGAAALFVLTRQLKGFTRKAGAAMAVLVIVWVPELTLAGLARPWPVLLFASWLCLMWPWARHYRWRPEAPEQVPHLDDIAIWRERIAAKRLKGTYLAEPGTISGGRTWTVMLPHGDLVPADVLANEARIAGAWDKPRTEVFVEPYPDGRESRAKLTILRRDSLSDIAEWDGQGIDLADGTAVIAKYADGMPARIRFYARRDGIRHGLIAGTTGAGKTYLLDLIIRIALTSGFIVPVVLDPQEGQSLPQWRRRVPYASGVDECMAMLRGLQAGMLDRSRYLSSLTWKDEDGFEHEGADFYDHEVAQRPMVLIIGDEYPVLLTDPKHGNEAIRLTADIGKRGRKTGVSLWPVAQVPSLSELGDQVVRSMLAGGNVICLRTGDRVSASMLGLDADPSSLPRYFADGSPTYGLGYVLGPDNRQATARTLLPSRAVRREVPVVPALDPAFAGALELAGRQFGRQESLPAMPVTLAPAPASGEKPGRTAADAVLAVLDREMTKGEIIEAARDLVAGKWKRPEPFAFRSWNLALTSLSEKGRISHPERGTYAPVRASLHVVEEVGHVAEAGN